MFVYFPRLGVVFPGCDRVAVMYCGQFCVEMGGAKTFFIASASLTQGLLGKPFQLCEPDPPALP